MTGSRSGSPLRCTAATFRCPSCAGFPRWAYTQTVSSVSPPDMDLARFMRAFFFWIPPREQFKSGNQKSVLAPERRVAAADVSVPSRLSSYSNPVGVKIHSTSHFTDVLLTAMETVDKEPEVLANRRGVMFSLVLPNGTVTCVIALTALETFFWLEPRASDTDVLRTFENGFARIRAIAERKFRAHPATHLKLTAEDFARP